MIKMGYDQTDQEGMDMRITLFNSDAVVGEYEEAVARCQALSDKIEHLQRVLGEQQAEARRLAWVAGIETGEMPGQSITAELVESKVVEEIAPVMSPAWRDDMIAMALSGTLRIDEPKVRVRRAA